MVLPGDSDIGSVAEACTTELPDVLVAAVFETRRPGSRRVAGLASGMCPSTVLNTGINVIVFSSPPTLSQGTKKLYDSPRADSLK